MARRFGDSKLKEKYVVNHSLIESCTKINNAELCEVFGCSPQGGMRRSHKTNTLVIVSNHIKSIYDDRWVGDVLYYTGMALKAIKA